MTTQSDIAGLSRLLIDACPDGIIAINEASRIMLANAALGRLFGHAPADLLGKDLGVLIPPRLAVQHERGLTRYVATGVRRLQWSGTRAVGLRSDGTEFPIEIAFGEATLNSGRTFLGYVRDLSDRDRMEAELRQAQKLEAIGKLAGGVAHDFNNLLTVMLAHCQFLMDALPPESATYADSQTIHLAGQRAAALTGQLLAFSRQQMLVPERVRLSEVVDGVSRMLSRVLGEHIVVSISARAADDHVLADRGQLEQVIVNLAVNARDAMAEGGTLTIDVDDAAQVADSAAADFVCLRVTDTGHGMDEATQARAFDPFFTTKKLGDGTGLGLATVFGIVSQSGGRITIRSAPGAGATFTVLWPRAKAAQGERTAGAEQPDEDLPPEKAVVLLVEDEASVRGVARKVLEGAGYVVIEARHGRDAKLVASTHEGPIDILVTDVVMPEVGGLELAQWFDSAHPGGRVLFVSGYTDAERRDALALRSPHFLSKPFTATSLLSAVRSTKKRSPG